jgi:ABC-type phosphate transport system substrate-binding protein
MARKIYFLLAAGLVCAAYFAIPGPRVSAAGDEVDVIVNKTNSVGEMSIPDARKIFTADKGTWPNGKRITVLMLAPGRPERAIVLSQIYKMTDSDYGKYFLQACFTGKVEAPPKDVSSPAEVKQDVAGNPGAIGYVSAADVDDSVKVVLKIQ